MGTFMGCILGSSEAPRAIPYAQSPNTVEEPLDGAFVMPPTPLPPLTQILLSIHFTVWGPHLGHLPGKESTTAQTLPFLVLPDSRTHVLLCQTLEAELPLLTLPSSPDAFTG